MMYNTKKHNVTRRGDDMKIIDSDKLDFSDVDFYSPDSKYAVEKIINDALTVNAIIIPEGATNGDMIKAMFNPYKICKYEFNVRIYMTERAFEESDYQMYYDRRWWNAPYKAESEVNADEASN